MEVSISILRSELASWIDRVRSGEEVVITDRGAPVARLVPVSTASLLDQLVEQGVLTANIAARFPLTEAAAALALAESRTLNGKVILLP